jgi:hypothetical protein
VEGQGAVGHQKGDFGVVVGEREEIDDLAVKVAVKLERELGEVVDADLWGVFRGGGAIGEGGEGGSSVRVAASAAAGQKPRGKKEKKREIGFLGAVNSASFFSFMHAGV